MSGHDHHVGAEPIGWIVLAVAVLLAALAVGGYLRQAALARQPWPSWRSASWIVGCLLGLGSFVLLQSAGSFESHMLGHLGLGMVTPLLLVVAAPITLLLNTLPVPTARRLSRLLRSRPLLFLTEPLVAATLNVGALWLLYATPLYGWQHQHPIVLIVVHLHMLAAGWLFTVSIVSVDPLPHRRSFLHRAIVLISALAAHDILAKVVYAHPPDGVGAAAARSGALLMYYGGDAVDIGLAVILCAAWYRRRGRSRVPFGESWWGAPGTRLQRR